MLIIGETGTGKELVARAIHAFSPRSDHRFSAVDCGTLSVELLESELFGHVKGSFTGAVSNKQGIFEAADQGTVFLDEICNINLEIQGKLLRFIQEREFMPVGGTETKHVDIRLVFATNRDLEKMVADGTFREDLYYRLYVYPIQLPSLRERREDIPAPAYHLLSKIQAQGEKKITGIPDRAPKMLEQDDWPGNICLLKARSRELVISCDGTTIEPHHLPMAVTRAGLPEAYPVPLRATENSWYSRRGSETGNRRTGTGICSRSFAEKRLERHPRGSRREYSKAELPGTDAQALHSIRTHRHRLTIPFVNWNLRAF